MKELGKKLLYRYERFFWYVQIATSELEKPIDVIKYVVAGATVLKIFGLNFDIIWIAWISGISIIALWIMGMILVKTGVVEYVAHLNNTQNAAMRKILDQ